MANVGPKGQMWAQMANVGPKGQMWAQKVQKHSHYAGKKNEGSGLLESHHFQKIFKKF